MRASATRPKLFLAILAFLVAIFACAALLRAQNLPPKNEPDTPAAGDPAMATRVNNSMLQARRLIDNFFQLTSNVVCTENWKNWLVAPSVSASPSPCSPVRAAHSPVSPSPALHAK